MTENQNEISSSELISNLSFCVFDLETTGGNHQTDKIIEIGLVKIENLKITAKKEFLIRPEIKIPDFIQKLTSIKHKDVENAPLIEEIIDDILDFMGDSILVAHNTSFDVPFFNSVLTRLDREKLTNKSICTNLMTKYLIPNLMNSNLHYMSKIFGIKHKQAHRALDDAVATANLILKFLNIFIDKNIQKINHLYYPRNRFELDRINFKKEALGNPSKIKKGLESLQCPFLATFKGKNGTILYSLPCRNTKNEKKLLLKKMEELPWEIFTIRLFGPFIEALIFFNSFINKFELDVRNEIVEFLKNEHFTKDDFGRNADITKCGDFFIANHLVPEQYVIYPTAILHHTSRLIFRFPGHQKKLLQYINSKSSKIAANKIKNVYVNPILKELIIKYLSSDSKHSSDSMMFQKEFPQKDFNGFVDNLNDFLSKHPNTYSYPKEYI